MAINDTIVLERRLPIGLVFCLFFVAATNGFAQSPNDPRSNQQPSAVEKTAPKNEQANETTNDASPDPASQNAQNDDDQSDNAQSNNDQSDDAQSENNPSNASQSDSAENAVDTEATGTSEQNKTGIDALSPAAEEPFDEAAFISEGEDNSPEDNSSSGTTGSFLDSTLSFNGSFENQLSALWPRKYDNQEDLYIYDYIQLRLGLTASLPSDVKIITSGIAKLFVGETEFKLVDSISKGSVDALINRDPRLGLFIEDTYTLENDAFLENAYAKIPIKTIQLTVGMQPLQFGAGYVWNPTDVFTTKDMLDPTYEKPGQVGLRIQIPIGANASLDLVGAPTDRFENWTAGGRATVRLGPITVTGVTMATTEKTTRLDEALFNTMMAETSGLDESDLSDLEEVINQVLLVTPFKRTLVGGELIADIKGMRIWAEGGYNFVEKKDHAPPAWWELSTGLEYFFPFETHFMAEYFHYGRGSRQTSGVYSFNAWMSLLSGETKMLGQDFLFESIDHPVANFWTVGLSSFQSISDGSAIITTDVKWEFIQDAELWLMVSAALGQRDDFFAVARGQSWLRLKVFF